jgi:hypothetical protein
MRLFKYEGYTVKISEEAYALKAFRDIWKRDKSETKDRAIMELGYCYFMEDPRSDYQYIRDEEDRSEEIIKGEGLPKSWKPDSLVLKARELYATFKTTSALLLEDTRTLVDNYRLKLRNIDLETLEVKEVKELGAIIKQVPALVKDLDEAEKAITAELVSSDKVRGAQTKSIFEDI